MLKPRLAFALGLVLFYLAYYKNGHAWAAWLFPALLLYASRHPRTRYVAVLFPVGVGLALQLALWHFASTDPSSPFFYVPFGFGLLLGLLFYADRLIWQRTHGPLGTLFFPLAYTSLEFVNGLLNPFGTTGLLGYSQFGFLPIAQLASITGMWGITFCITSVGSLMAKGEWRNARGEWSRRLLDPSHFAIHLSLLAIIYGMVRLNAPTTGPTVRVAGLHTLDRAQHQREFAQPLRRGDTLTYHRASEAQLRRLVAATKEQAHRGAEVVLWSECSPLVLRSHEAALLDSLKALARQQHIYLMACPYIESTDGQKPENKLWLFSPQGELVYTHYKYGGNFMEGTVEGDGHLKTLDTPHGRLAGIICWDADFPAVVRQLGESTPGTLQAELVLLPAWDWQAIDPLHTRVAVFRAIENGCSWVRQTQDGLSIMVDARGRTLTQMDHFETNHWVMAGNVPTTRAFTLYPLLGDWFGWLALAGLVAFMLVMSDKR
jgi:apolipoprotein N-acyltransferase